MDKQITSMIYNFFHKHQILRQIPYYFGVVPYEIYSLFGFFIGVIQLIWINNLNPLQIHILPHLLCYSIFNFLKGIMKRERPGAVYKRMGHYINSKYTLPHESCKSFPSAHSGLAFSLSTAIAMEMNASKNPTFFNFPVKQIFMRQFITFIAFFISFCVVIQRIMGGYHYFLDTLFGAVLGSIIGYISWTSIEKKHYKKKDIILRYFFTFILLGLIFYFFIKMINSPEGFHK